MEKADLTTNVVYELEDKFPQHDRRSKGWKLTGFVEAKGQAPTDPLRYPYGHVPIWKYIGWEMNKKYTGEKLREIRKTHK